MQLGAMRLCLLCDQTMNVLQILHLRGIMPISIDSASEVNSFSGTPTTPRPCLGESN